MAISPLTQIGSVSLRVRNMDQSIKFYREVLGLSYLTSDKEGVTMGDANKTPLVYLADWGQDQLLPKPPGTTGLFHFAILLPDRAALGQSLARFIEHGGKLQGASDHLVSEALYLTDPNGLGIELYRDRPREEWQWEDGLVKMATLPLDLQSLLDEYKASGYSSKRPVQSARMGHVHLSVTDLAEAEAYYCGKVGFQLTCRYPGAIFVSAGGYHHHLGLNTWARSAPPPDCCDLSMMTILVPETAEELHRVGKDPFGNLMWFEAASV